MLWRRKVCWYVLQVLVTSGARRNKGIFFASWFWSVNMIGDLVIGSKAKGECDDDDRLLWVR